MKAVSLFAGIGGFDLGLERAGFTITDQVEREPFCQRILAARWPHVTRRSDVREWTGDGHEPVDLLCGGFPCQDLSVAGRRKGLSGERSGLFWEIVRIAKAVQPTWGLFENVPGLFSAGGGRDMATVLEGLRQCWPVVGYRVLDSRYWGVAQRRRRVFFVCGPTEASVEQVLFEHEGGGGDFEEGDEAGPHIAASLRSRSCKPGVNPPGRGGEDDMNIVCAPLIGKPYGDQQGDESKLIVAATLKQRGRGYTDEVMDNLQICQAITNLGSGGPDDNEAQAGHLVTHALTGEGFDASEDGTGRGVPLTVSNGVRRLTPTECERLQAFPDGWTCLCQPIEAYESMRCTCPDGARYKALGNAVTVTVIEWFGRRLAQGVLAL